MTHFYQAAVAAILAVIICLTLGSGGKDMAALLVIAVCCMILFLAVTYLRPVLDFLEKLETLGNLNGEMIGCLIKIVGIGLLSEIVSLLCSDAGNASLGKVVQMLSTAVSLWLALPVFQAVVDLVQKILGGL